MGRYRPALFLGLAFVVAVVITVVAYNWLRGLEADRQKQAGATFETTMAAVANSDLAWGTKLQREMVQMTAYPKSSLPDGSFNSPNVLNGRVLLVPVKRNELLLESKLAPVTAATGGVSAVLDPSKRAMAVKVDDVIGVAGFIKSGDRVDVMVTIQPSQESGNVVSKVVLQNIRVLAAGTQMERSGKDQEAKPVQVITLEVDMQEAEKLTLASNQGRLRLALRNPINAEPVLTEGITVTSLLRSYQSQSQPKPKSKPKTVRVARPAPVAQPEPVAKSEPIAQPASVPPPAPVPPEETKVEFIRGVAIKEIKF